MTPKELLDSIDVSLIPEQSFLTPSESIEFHNLKIKLSEIKEFIYPAIEVDNIVKLPEKVKDRLKETVRELSLCYTGFFDDLSKIGTLQAHKNFSKIKREIEALYNNVFSIAVDNETLKAIQLALMFKKDFFEPLMGKTNNLVKELERHIKKTDEINKALENRAAKVASEDYIKIFAQEEKTNNKAAQIWLNVSIIFSSLVILLLVFSMTNDWFSISKLVTTVDPVSRIEKTSYIYNYPNIISKFVMLSFCIYLVTFCFKQYSIKKHLKEISSHKKNTLSVFPLLQASLSEKDLASRSTLMIQLSKAIYENPSTGYIHGAQNENPGQGILELTKYVSESK